MGEENKIRDAADAVKGVFEAVPIYEDALRPAAKELGKALETVAKTVHIVLAPLSALVWGYEQISEFIATTVAEKLKDTPRERIASPAANVAGPALEALKYTGEQPALREMYANLLATSIDTKTAEDAHPAFVEIIKQLTPDEARIIALFNTSTHMPIISIRSRKQDSPTNHAERLNALNFSVIGEEAGCTHPNLTQTYLDNLSRLGLINIVPDQRLTKPDAYTPLETHTDVVNLQTRLTEQGLITRTERGLVRATNLGLKFISACVIGQDHS